MIEDYIGISPSVFNIFVSSFNSITLGFKTKPFIQSSMMNLTTSQARIDWMGFLKG